MRPISRLFPSRFVRTTAEKTAGIVFILALAGCSVFGRTIGRSESSQPLAGASPDSISIRETQASKLIPTSRIPTEDISGLPGIDSLAEGWNEIKPGGDTRCAHGGEYSFFVRKTQSSRLLIYFEGGGSCYDAESCRVGSNRYDDSIDTNFPADNPALKEYGLFALDDPRNPFHDSNIVFLNYCTGDGSLGNRVVRYQDSQGAFDIHHVGFINAQTVLEWVYKNFPQPEQPAIVGCSAGVTGAYFHFPYIKLHYPSLPITLVGDSGGGFVDGPKVLLEQLGTLDVLPSWIEQYDQLVNGPVINSKVFFTAAAQAFPESRFSLVDSQEDSVQAGILSLWDPSLSLAELLRTNAAALQAPNFQTYTGPGDFHCVTMDGNYYDYETNGVKLNDWITGLVNGEPTSSVKP